MSSATTAPSASPEIKKKSKKGFLLILGLLLLLGAAGAGSWVYLQRQAGDTAQADGSPARKTKPLFTPLDVFTVNLQDTGGDHYAQIGITLQIEDASVDSEIKAHMPAIRNNILLLLASKSSDELLTLEGKQQLARQIGVRTAQGLGLAITAADTATAGAIKTASPSGAPEKAPRKTPAENPIKGVLFSQFIIQ